MSSQTAERFPGIAASSVESLYEQPLSERMRTFLRLEYLYQQLLYHLEQPQAGSTRIAVAGLLDMVAILGRGDVRGDVLKELERQIFIFDRYQHLPGVDEARLRRVLRNLQELRQRLFAVGSQFLHPVRESEFLAAIKHRSAIPGGTCEFDLPNYSHWLRQPYAQRRADIEFWLENIRPLCDSIAELLWLLRESGEPSERVAINGVYQHALGDTAVGLLRIQLPPDSGLYPEISGSHHRFSVRFMQWPETRERATQTARDVQFRLTIC
ncbi:MAG: cell division protein ZapD [Chromatiales bacterium]|nr:cell division protein ZapD [Chromatiales bacterium]